MSLRLCSTSVSRSLSRFVCSQAILTFLMLTGCSAPEAALDDVVWIPGQPVFLRAYVERIGWLGLRNGTEDIEVTFRFGDQTLGSGRTNDEGYCELVYEIDHVGDTPILSIEGHVKHMRLVVAKRAYSWHADRTIMAVDLDDTISQTDYDDLILDLVDRESVPIPGSVETLNTLADSFHIAYVTARPRFTHEKTQRWLQEHGYPKGPLYTSPTLSEVVNQAEFKVGFLRKLQRSWPHLLIGIGDKSSDRKAYRKNGMLAIILGDDDKDLGDQQDEREDEEDEDEDDDDGSDEHIITLADWNAIGAFFKQNEHLLTSPDQLKSALREPTTHKWHRP